MNRSLKLSMLIALALGSSQALALDLGQVQVKSALGQPLLAEIPLNPVNPSEMQGLTVQLASSDEFARAGIVGGRTKVPLHFAVAANASGQPVIRITSTVAVDDPYLDLLLEVNDKAGKSVREFAILLDPPGSSPAAPAMAAAALPPHSAAAPVTRTTSAAEPQHTMEPPKPAARSAGASVGQYGPVERGQTLSSIARSHAVAGVNEAQMLLAIKQANPNAFYRDNINALKTGAVLRIPTATEAQTMTVAAAIAEARRQNSDWRSSTPSTATTTVADAATRSTASSSPSSTASDLGDRLALVPAKDGSSASGKSGSTAGKSDKASLAAQQDLLRAKEGLASAEQQSADLQSRLKDLEDINSKNERLLSLKENEIAELQNKLAAARKAAGMPVAAPVAESSAAAPAPGSNASVAGVAPAASAAALAAEGGVKLNSAAAASATSVPAPASSSLLASAASVEPAAAAKLTPAAQAPAEPAVMTPPVAEPWYMQTWAWAAAGGIVILLLLLALLGRRKSRAIPERKSASSLSDRFGDASSMTPPGAGEDTDQAELLNQLAEHPDDINLHLELVALYYSRRDVEHFEAAAEAMYAHVSDPQQDEWQDVLHMGEDLAPTHPLFDHHAVLPADTEAEARQEFDIDAYAPVDDVTTLAATTTPVVPAAPKKVSEYNFNFDLTRPDAAAAEAASMSNVPFHDDAAALRAAEAPAVPAKSADDADSALDWQFDDADTGRAPGVSGSADGSFSDDPVDTKLDLARAYLDMGDADGARAMLGEVVAEGTQVQRDVAKRLLEGLH